MKSLQMTTQNHKFKLTLLGLVMQGMGLMAHAACGTQTGTDYTFDTSAAVSCIPPTNATNITVNNGVALTPAISGQSIIYFDYPNHLTTFSNAGALNGVGNPTIYIGWPTAVVGTDTIDTFTNKLSGQITSSGSDGVDIDQYGVVSHLVNYGLISARYVAVSLFTGGIIDQLDNYGTLKSTSTGSYNYGIYNGGTINTLNNAQGVGNTNGALTYSGTLPAVKYNIIITSTSNYGQLAVTNGTGNTTFGVSSLSTRGNGVLGNYPSIITGVTNTQLGVTGTTATGTSNGYGYTLTESVTTLGSEVWDLTIGSAPAPLPTGPSAADTQESLTQAATALRSVFNQQTAVINNSLNYDCTVFAENGVCVSAGGRFATPNSITGEQMSTLLVGSYKAMKDIRVGGFIDQNASTPNVTGISINKSPMYGVFGVWNQNPDLMGYEVRLATNWSNQDITQTRNVVGTSEAGTGTASLKSQAISGVVSYSMPVTDSTWIASPYAGIRKTKVTRGSYTETSAVTTPLTYSDLSQDITTALAGVRMNKKFSDNVYVTGSVGVEQNIGSSISTLDATGVTGLTATDFSANYAKTRPVASAGASYAINKNQRLSLSAMYRKEAFQTSGSTTALLMYQVGL